MTVGKIFVFILILYSEVLSKKTFKTSKLREPIKVTQDNLEATLKDKKGVFLYATRDDCEKCNQLYNKFETVSQTFASEKDIAFGYFTDRVLADQFDVGSLPEIVYYGSGSAAPKLNRGDITASALTKVVKKSVKADLRHCSVRYAVQLTTANFDYIMGSEKQNRLVMLHENQDMDDIEVFDELAETYDNDREIVFARIDVDKEKFLDNKYITKSYPSFYWYPAGTVDKKKRYGGQLKVEQLIAFINQKTGLQRIKGGKLSPSAGLIKELDDVIDKHAKRLYELRDIDNVIRDMKSAVAKLPAEVDDELSDYYLHLLEELKEDKTMQTISESASRLYREMDSAGPLKLDQLHRKINIANGLMDIISKIMLRELSGGVVDISQQMQTENVEHVVEFHEEF